VGETPRPDPDTPAAQMQGHAFGLVRVLDLDGTASGPWDPQVSPEVALAMLRAMALTRAFDDRMFRAQRQGKTSFYMKSLGEEAVSIAAAFALDDEDMLFLLSPAGPADRAQPRSGRHDEPDLLQPRRPYEGPPVADHVFGEGQGLLLDLGQPCHPASQAVGWAMASGARGDTRIAAAWLGEGSTAEGDFHSACTFASVYRAPGSSMWSTTSGPFPASPAWRAVMRPPLPRVG
jgi:2-oxoisovalerate dehydrogenase E1 component alpha subunit